MQPHSRTADHLRLLSRLTAEESERSVDLKPFPTAAVRALELAQQPGIVPRQIIEVVQSEPVITARMLQLVNSSLFGLQRRIDDLEEAGEYLGCEQLVEVATTAAYASQHSGEGFLRSNQAEFLWRRSMAVALCSASLSTDGSETGAYLTGLLEGLGLLWIAQRLPDRFARRMHQLYSHGRTPERAQHVILRTNYCLKSAELMRQWELPEIYVEAITKLGQGRIDCPTTEAVAAGRELAAALVERHQIPEYLDWSLVMRPDGISLLDMGFGIELKQRYEELSVLPAAA
jgi:HD-like signal output (HDOD) protein